MSDAETGWFGELKDHHDPVFIEHPVHFAESFFEVLKIPDAKSHHHRIEAAFSEPQVF